MSLGDDCNNAYLAQMQLQYALNRQRSMPLIQPSSSNSKARYGNAATTPVVAFCQPKHITGNNGNGQTSGVACQLQSSSNSNKSKHASVELYRPPHVRIESVGSKCVNEVPMSKSRPDTRKETSPATQKNNHSSKLNVHAREFTLPQDVRFRGNDNDSYIQPILPVVNTKSMYPLITSKSSGNLMKHANNGPQPEKRSSKVSYCGGLQRTKSSASVTFLKSQSKNSKIDFKDVPESVKISKSAGKANSPKPGNRQTLQLEVQNEKITSFNQMNNIALKRCRSLNAADALKLTGEFYGQQCAVTDFSIFPSNLQAVIEEAVKDANQMSDRNLMVLSRKMLECAICDRRYTIPVAKVSVSIIQKDKKGTYLDSVLNTCQMWFQERNSKLRKMDGSSCFLAFMAFLTEFYIQLKRTQLQCKVNTGEMSPSLMLLSLLANCCQDLLVYTNKHSLSEVECLFLVLTTIGRDLESELRSSAVKLHNTMKDVFLNTENTSQVKRTLLQLIELRAAKWQLPISALNYYYPKFPK